MIIRQKHRLKFLNTSTKPKKGPPGIVKTIQGKRAANFEPEAREQLKPLFLVMQRKWFNLIECGEKLEEYRDDTEYYFARLCNRDKAGNILSLKNYKKAILQEGYHVGARRLIVEIRKITYQNEFIIHIGKILERINF